MARVGASKKKKSPRATEISQLKKEVQRLTEQLKSCQRELESSNSQLRESLEQQTTTSEILRVIARTPADLQPVLDVVAHNAARLCEANDAIIYRVDADGPRPIAHYGPVPAFQQHHRPLSRGLPVGRAIIDRRTIHIHDLATELETEFPDGKFLQQATGTRTMLATPLLREGSPIGAISIRRTEVRPFSEKQIALLETFADQAVIAIENVRLFKELKEALVQQTATSEILGVIASSPTEIQPVLDAVAKNAARLCEAADAQIRLIEADRTRLVASFGSLQAPEFAPIGPRNPSGRAILTRQTLPYPCREVQCHPWAGANSKQQSHAGISSSFRYHSER